MVWLIAPSFFNQVLAQMHLWEARFADLSEVDKKANLWLKILPKKLDEEVVAVMVASFGGVMTKLTTTQADCIKVSFDGPFKAEIYKY